jgi:protein TonB
VRVTTAARRAAIDDFRSGGGRVPGARHASVDADRDVMSSATTSLRAKSPQGRPTDRAGDPRRSGGAPIRPAQTTRAVRSAAWLFSLLLHAALLAVVLYVFQPLERRNAPNPERLVYVEPAPPPPPLPGSGGAAAEEAKPQPEPESAPQPLQLAEAPKARPTAHRSPKPTHAVRQPTAEPTHAPVQTGTGGGGEPGGQAGGVPGGVPGGQVGGTVGGHGDAPIGAELVAVRAEAVTRVKPEYPEAARLRRIEGLVVLRITVDRAGQVEPDIKVVQSIPLLDDAAIAAARQWRFTPARDRDGQTVRTQFELPMRFQLR